MFVGINLDKTIATFILIDGTMVTFFLNILSIALFAQNSGDIPFNANSTSATLLNSVSTGPGHKHPIYTNSISQTG